MDTRTQAWVDAGFLDPTADDFDEMCEVLLWYEDLGFGPDEFTALLAETPDRGVPASRAERAKTNAGRADIINVVNERFLRPGQRFSAEEARQALGLEEDKFQRMIAAGGYNPSEQFTQLDIDGFAAFAASESLFSDEELLHFTRVLSTAMSRVADASTSLFQFDVASHIEAGGGSLLDWAQANYVAAQLVDSIFEPMRSLFLHELVGSVRRTDYARENRLDQDNRSTVCLAVGFVDIVGYTPLTERLSADELATFIRDFEELVSTVVTSRHDGRIVKLIGDEVMFIAVTPDQACAIASDLVTAFAGTEAKPRGGIGFGDMVTRGGDFYGRVVNTTSRIASLAVPGEVLVDTATKESAERYVFEGAGRRELKGMLDPIMLWSLAGETSREATSPN